jgi:hypothetical protein
MTVRKRGHSVAIHWDGVVGKSSLFAHRAQQLGNLISHQKVAQELGGR